MRRSAFTLALAALALAAPGDACAQEQEQLELIERQIETGKAAEARIAQEIAAAIEAQDRVAEQLAAIAQSIQAQEQLVAASEAELKRLAADRVSLLTELGENQDALSELLAGLQRLEQNPPPALVVEPGDILAALRGAMLLGTLVPELGTEAEALTLKLDQLGEVEATISARRKDMAGEIARLESQRVELGRLVSQKKALVSQSSEELDAERKRTKSLADKAKSLKQLLASLEEERKRKAEEEARRQAEEAEALRKQEELRRVPRMDFAGARGKLPFPAQGQIVRRYGEPDGLGGETQGLMIATRAGAQVTTPADGKVEFAGPFRSYGQVVILNPGGGYRVLLAGMDKVTADVGEFLRAGEPVGEMGSGPASVTLFGEVVQDGRPVLYIEFRNSTEAVDSGPWWIGGLKEAHG